MWNPSTEASPERAFAAASAPNEARKTIRKKEVLTNQQNKVLLAATRLAFASRGLPLKAKPGSFCEQFCCGLSSSSLEVRVRPFPALNLHFPQRYGVDTICYFSYTLSVVLRPSGLVVKGKSSGPGTTKDGTGRRRAAGMGRQPRKAVRALRIRQMQFTPWGE